MPNSSPASPATFNSNVAREINCLRDRKGRFWEDRYHAIIVSGEEATQIDRLIYVLSNGVKEGLVERLADWLGVHAARLFWAEPPSKARGSTAPRL